MAHQQGFKIKLSVKNPVDDTWHSISGETECSYSSSKAEIDASDKDDGVNGSYLGGQVTRNMSISGNTDFPDEFGLELLENAELNSTDVELRYNFLSGSNKKAREGVFTMLSFNTSANLQGLETYSAEFKASGPVTVVDVP